MRFVDVDRLQHLNWAASLFPFLITTEIDCAEVPSAYEALFTHEEPVELLCT